MRRSVPRGGHLCDDVGHGEVADRFSVGDLAQVSPQMPGPPRAAAFRDGRGRSRPLPFGNRVCQSSHSHVPHDEAHRQPGAQAAAECDHYLDRGQVVGVVDQQGGIDVAEAGVSERPLSALPNCGLHLIPVLWP